MKSRPSDAALHLDEPDGALSVLGLDVIALVVRRHLQRVTSELPFSVHDRIDGCSFSRLTILGVLGYVRGDSAA